MPPFALKRLRLEAWKELSMAADTSAATPTKKGYRVLVSMMPVSCGGDEGI